MKIIISSSKTQKTTYNTSFKTSDPYYLNESDEINNILKHYDKVQLKKIYKASDKIIDDTFDNISYYDNADTGQAIFSYQGAVFREVKADTLNEKELNYLNDNLVVLSAHYGALKPFDMIKPYRLDFNTRLPDVDLKSFWKDKINNYLGDYVIINLASNEFSSLITRDKIDIEFKEIRNNQLKVVSTYAKMARGEMVHLLAKHGIKNADDIKALDIMGYRYSCELSDDNKYLFIK